MPNAAAIKGTTTAPVRMNDAPQPTIPHTTFPMPHGTSHDAANKLRLNSCHPSSPPSSPSGRGLSGKFLRPLRCAREGVRSELAAGCSHWWTLTYWTCETYTRAIVWERTYDRSGSCNMHNQRSAPWSCTPPRLVGIAHELRACCSLHAQHALTRSVGICSGIAMNVDSFPVD
eukprot:761135-Prorocentrum_minimum.AAC.3